MAFRPNREFINAVAQGIVGTGIIAGLSLLATMTPSAVSGCPVEVRPAVNRGESELLRGDIERSAAIAEDALAQAPESACSHELAAAAASAQRQIALRHGKKAEAEVFRRACVVHAEHADTLVGTSPRVQALKDNCMVIS